MRHVGLGKHLVEWQVEARHAGAHPRRHAGNARLAAQARLHALGDSLIASQRSAFRVPHVHDDFGATGVRKELLLHPPHAHNAKGEEEQGGQYRDPPVRDTPGDGAPEHTVKRAVEHIMATMTIAVTHRTVCADGLHVFRRLEDQRAQVGHKKDRDQP